MAALLGTQFLLHALFESPLSGANAPTAVHGQAGSAPAVFLTAMGHGTGAAAGVPPCGSPTGTVLMVVAHLACAAVLGSLLARGDAALGFLERAAREAARHVAPGVRRALAVLARVATGASTAAVPLGVGARPRSGAGGFEPPWRPGRRLLDSGGHWWRGPPGSLDALVPGGVA